MPNNIGTLVAAPVRPAGEADTFPSAYANEIKGGLHAVETLVQRDVIPAERREDGMLCAVGETGTVYQLRGGTDNAGWVSVLAKAADYADVGDYVAHVQNGVLFGFIVPRTYIWISGGINLAASHTGNDPFTLSIEVDGSIIATLEVAYGETESTATNFPVVFLEGQKVRVLISNAVSGEAYYFFKGIALQETEAAWPGETPDGATLQADDTIGWAPAPQAVAYRLHLASLVDFSDVSVYVTTAALHSFSNLPAGTYHWKIEPVFADGNRGAESAARTFTTA